MKALKTFIKPFETLQIKYENKSLSLILFKYNFWNARGGKA